MVYGAGCMVQGVCTVRLTCTVYNAGIPYTKSSRVPLHGEHFERKGLCVRGVMARGIREAVGKSGRVVE
jgi:hypothetical protein